MEQRKVFGGEPESRLPRTKSEIIRRIMVLADKTCDAGGKRAAAVDLREDLKRRCAKEHLPYNSEIIYEAIGRAKGWQR